MPGLAASSKIFEYIKLPHKSFECHYLEWSVPDSIDESLESYAKKYASQIQQEEVVLVGVSFGGILVQEISRLIEVKKLIIISSIRDEDELPRRLKYLRRSGMYKLFPSRRLSLIDDFSKFDFHPHLRKKGELYNKYFSKRNEKYLNWAIRNVLYWRNTGQGNEVVQIHGTKDEIFPIKYIKDCIPVEGGSHAMIIVKAKKISAIIKNLLEDDT